MRLQRRIRLSVCELRDAPIFDTGAGSAEPICRRRGELLRGRGADYRVGSSVRSGGDGSAPSGPETFSENRRGATAFLVQPSLVLSVETRPRRKSRSLHRRPPRGRSRREGLTAISAPVFGGLSVPALFHSGWAEGDRGFTFPGSDSTFSSCTPVGTVPWSRERPNMRGGRIRCLKAGR